MNNHIYEILMYGGLSKSDYNYTNLERHMYNRISITFLSLLSGVTYIILLLLSTLAEVTFADRAVYALCIFISLSLFAISVSRFKSNTIFIDVSVLLFSCMLFGFGIYTSILKNPTERSDIFMVILFIIPIIFTLRPIFNIILTATGEFCYLLLLNACCDTTPNYLPNVGDSLLFFTLGCILGVYFSNVKIRGFYNSKRNRELLETDSLTKLLNRWSYENELTNLQDVHAIKAVIVLDVNNLKQINDNLGHKAGDELICGAASCIRYAFSKYGKCFRTGGDEFVVFISKDYDSQERLLQYFDRITSAWHGITVQTLSISYGFLAVTDNLPITELIQKADALMYENKREYHRHLADR